MSYKLFLAFIVIIFSSCQHEFKGKIEKRENGVFYLINTSSSKVYRFTINLTRTTNDTLVEYFSYGRIVAPGGEYKLGKEFTKSDMLNRDGTEYIPNSPEYPKNIKHNYKIGGEIEVMVSDLKKQEEKDFE